MDQRGSLFLAFLLWTSVVLETIASHDEKDINTPVSANREVTSSGISTSKPDSDRGDALAIETNSELLSTGPGQHDSMCPSDGASCLDCRTVGYCKAGSLTRVTCRGLYPYCDQRTGTCTSERHRCKPNTNADNFDCPAQGYFPDPESCRAFYVCEGTPLKAYKFQCAQLQVYDHEQKKCSRPTFRLRCQGFTCLGKQGRYTPYATDDSIYAMCKDGRATMGLFQCPEGEAFDETKQKCSAKCTSESSKPDLDDATCKKYIKCVKSGNKFTSSHSSCPGQRLFDPEKGRCVDKSEYTCPPTTTTTTTTTVTSVSSSTSSTTEKPGRIGLTNNPLDQSLFREAPITPNADGHAKSSDHVTGNNAMKTSTLSTTNLQTSVTIQQESTEKIKTPVVTSSSPHKESQVESLNKPDGTKASSTGQIGISEKNEAVMRLHDEQIQKSVSMSSIDKSTGNIGVQQSQPQDKPIPDHDNEKITVLTSTTSDNQNKPIQIPSTSTQSQKNS